MVDTQSIQSKITQHAKKLENTAQSKEENKLIETDAEITQMIESLDKDIKPLIKQPFELCYIYSRR